MKENIQYADLSRMTGLPKCAVICRTTEEVEAFYHNSKQQLSEYMHWDLDGIINTWRTYGSHTGFTLIVGNDKPGSMSWCYENWFRDEGYEIVEFSDLADVTDIEESDQPVDIIFGGVI